MTHSDHLLLGVARSVERVDSTAPSTNEVDVVTALDALVRVIIEHNRCLLTGEPADWTALANLLRDVARACRRLQSTNPRDSCGSQLSLTDRE